MLFLVTQYCLQKVAFLVNSVSGRRRKLKVYSPPVYYLNNCFSVKVRYYLGRLHYKQLRLFQLFLQLGLSVSLRQQNQAQVSLFSLTERSASNNLCRDLSCRANYFTQYPDYFSTVFKRSLVYCSCGKRLTTLRYSSLYCGSQGPLLLAVFPLMCFISLLVDELLWTTMKVCLG